GIGLAVVQRLVVMHRGTVEADSNGKDQGSEFTVRLPVLLSPASPPPPNIPEHAQQLEHASRVLVVDDNHDGADSLTTLLQLSGHSVQTAYTGPSALEAAAAFLPDVVLLDIGLPGLTGYEVARRLRKIEPLQDAWLIALTG